MPLAMTGPQVCWKRTRNSSARAPVSSCACAQVAPEHERRRPPRGPRGRSAPAAPGPASAARVDDRGLLGVDAAARHDVGAVAVHRDEQRLERAAHRAVVDVDQDRAGASRISRSTSAACTSSTTSRLASATTSSSDDPVGRGIRPQPVERVGPRRRRQHLLHPQQRVVAGGAGAAPVLGQPLLALEDLLDDHPGVTGRRRRAARGSRRGRPGRRGGRSGSRRPRRGRAARAAGRGWP